MFMQTLLKTKLAHSADYMQGTRLSFRSKEDAIHFVEKQGQFGQSYECSSRLISTFSRLGLLRVSIREDRLRHGTDYAFIQSTP